MPSFTKQLELEGHDKVMLYRGVNHDGREFFAYIKCDKKGYNAMQADHEHGRSAEDLNKYGESIYADFKQDPDEKAEHFLKNWLANNS